MEHPIFQKIENANNPDFGDILSRSFELFKKVWEQALYHVLIIIAVVTPMILVIYIPYILFIFFGIEQGSYGSYNNYDYANHSDITPFIPFIILYFLIFFVVIFIVQAIVLGITAHFFKVLKKEDTGKPEEVGDYFSMIQGNYKKLFGLSLGTFGIALLATLLCYLPIFYVMVPLQLIGVMFAFNPELSVKENIKACFKLGNKFWLTIFGLIILSSIIAQLGILLCIIGVFFTAFFVHVPIYYLYKDTVGFDDTSDDGSLLVS